MSDSRRLPVTRLDDPRVVLAPGPFLLVGLISAIRRVLVVTAEFGELRAKEEVFLPFLVELGVMTVLIVALTVSLVLLRKAGTTLVAKRE